MARLSLHFLGSPVLREVSAPVDGVDADLRRLAKNLLDTMYANSGVGLAANQVGVARRIAVVDTGDDDPTIVLINPEIVEREGSVRGEEGCLSIPEIFGDVERAERIVVETGTLDGDRQRFELRDLAARAVLHEIDHLDGILFLDHLSPLKRMMLLKKWKKFRKGEMGHVEDLTADVSRR